MGWESRQLVHWTTWQSDYLTGQTLWPVRQLQLGGCVVRAWSRTAREVTFDQTENAEWSCQKRTYVRRSVINRWIVFALDFRLTIFITDASVIACQAVVCLISRVIWPVDVSDCRGVRWMCCQTSHHEHRQNSGFFYIRNLPSWETLKMQRYS